MYKIGQSVVHLSHGVGVITGIEKREFSPGKVSKFYIVTIQDNGAAKKTFVPFESTENRLRPVMDKKTANAVLAFISSGTTVLNDLDQTWNRRYREYMELIHTGNAMLVAQVYVSLRALQTLKGLSFGERKLLDHTKTMLSKELEAVGLSLPEVTHV
jgi:CarD family transcriptional regulator